MAKEDVFRALHLVLIENVYPMNPSLMRNDSKAARIVVEHVANIAKFHHECWGKDMNRLTIAKQNMVFRYFMLKPLAHMSEASVRKYISELWRMGWFSEFIAFAKVTREDR